MKITIESDPVDPAAYLDPFSPEILADVRVQFDDGHVITFKAEAKSVMNLTPDEPESVEEFSAPALAYKARESGDFQVSFHKLRDVQFIPPVRRRSGPLD